MSYIEIKEELLKLQDKKYCEFNAKLCPDTRKKMIESYRINSEQKDILRKMKQR